MLNNLCAYYLLMSPAAIRLLYTTDHLSKISLYAVEPRYRLFKIFRYIEIKFFYVNFSWDIGVLLYISKVALPARAE